MFILTGVDLNQDTARVFDTSDQSSDSIRLSVLVGHIKSSKLAVRGLSVMQTPTGRYLDNYGVYLDSQDANNAVVEFKQSMGNV